MIRQSGPRTLNAKEKRFQLPERKTCAGFVKVKEGHRVFAGGGEADFVTVTGHGSVCNTPPCGCYSPRSTAMTLRWESLFCPVVSVAAFDCSIRARHAVSFSGDRQLLGSAFITVLPWSRCSFLDLSCGTLWPLLFPACDRQLRIFPNNIIPRGMETWVYDFDRVSRFVVRIGPWHHSHHQSPLFRNAWSRSALSPHWICKLCDTPDNLSCTDHRRLSAPMPRQARGI